MCLSRCCCSCNYRLNEQLQQHALLIALPSPVTKGQELAGNHRILSVEEAKPTKASGQATERSAATMLF